MNSVGRCEKGMCRTTNEDAIFIFNTPYGCLPNLFIVADGMGGHKAGEIASNSAINFFCEYVHENRMKILIENYDYLDIIKKGILYANNKVYEKSKENDNLTGMGTTFIVASIHNNKLFVGNVGDSRLYVIRNGEIIQITIDHTLVMEMLKSGDLTEEELFNHPNKNIITRAVGTQSEVNIDTFEIQIYSNDIIMMCSDGLNNMLKDNEVVEIIYKNNNIDDAIQTLINCANEKGGLDNISIILINDCYKGVN